LKNQELFGFPNLSGLKLSEKKHPLRTHIATILLGSNIEPEKYLPEAMKLLKQSCRVLRTSRVWETEAIGSNGPDFLNAAVEIETPLTADELKYSVLRLIESRLGRERKADRYANRTLDLDIIIFNGRVIDEGLWQRSFIAAPVSDLHPALMLPGESKTLLEAFTDLQVSAFARIYKNGRLLLDLLEMQG
jgi:2-amino-4-hydroxy-6-hydroxymethyldihydropteridine diphosphokinase